VKPRIRIRHGIWYCGEAKNVLGKVFLFTPYGQGYTPKAAYLDWKEQQ